MPAGSGQLRVQLYASRSIAATAAPPAFVHKGAMLLQKSSFTQLKNAVHWSLLPMFGSEPTSTQAETLQK